MIYVQNIAPDTLMLSPDKPGRDGVMLKGSKPGDPAPEIEFSDAAAEAFARELTYFEERGHLKIREGEPDEVPPPPVKKGGKAKA